MGFLYDDQDGCSISIGRLQGLIIPDWWPVLIAVTAVPTMLVEGRTRRLGFFGASSASAVMLFRLPSAGREEEAVLVLASFGSAILLLPLSTA